MVAQVTPHRITPAALPFDGSFFTCDGCTCVSGRQGFMFLPFYWREYLLFQYCSVWIVS